MKRFFISLIALTLSVTLLISACSSRQNGNTEGTVVSDTTPSTDSSSIFSGTASGETSSVTFTTKKPFVTSPTGSSVDGTTDGTSEISETSETFETETDIAETSASSDTASAETMATNGMKPMSKSLSEVYTLMKSVNNIDNILATYPYITQNITYFDDVTGDYNIYVYADSSMIVQEDSDANVMIMSGHDSYGYDTELGSAYRCLFVGNGIYENYWNGTWEYILFTSKWTDEETVRSAVSDGVFCVVTTEINEEVDGEKAINVYTLDAATMLIQSVNNYYEHSDGTTEPICECSIDYNPEPYNPSLSLKNQVYGAERTVTVIADPDTPNETAYSVQVSFGVSVQIFPAANYSTLYEDRACTIPHTQELDSYADCTLYVASGK